MKEAERLMQANVLRDKEDVYYLTLDEFRDVVRNGTDGYVETLS